MKTRVWVEVMPNAFLGGSPSAVQSTCVLLKLVFDNGLHVVNGAVPTKFGNSARKELMEP